MIWNIIESDEDIKYINYIFEFISCIILLFAALLHKGKEKKYFTLALKYLDFLNVLIIIKQKLKVFLI